jgi:glycosyltransferase involved in cell wall biosynthesis
MIKNSFVLISCHYNSSQFFKTCYNSCVSQDDDDLGIIFIDDNSSYIDRKVFLDTFDGLKKVGRNYFTAKAYGKDILVLLNDERIKSAALNQYLAIKHFVKNPDALCGIIDADDYLYQNATKIVRQEIGDNWMFCSDNKKKTIIPDFNKNIRKQDWTIQHFRGWKKKLSDKVRLHSFFRDKEIIGPGSDLSYIYPMMEMAGPERIKHINRQIYHYNNKNPINDFAVNLAEQCSTKRYEKTVDPYDRIDVL